MLDRKPVLFVDSDDTLVNTEFGIERCHMLRKADAVRIGQVWVATVVRPSAAEFLSELASEYSICVLSNGDSDIQKRILEIADLSKYIKVVYGRDSFSVATGEHYAKKILRGQGWALVDDQSMSSPHTERKMAWLGIYQECETFAEWKAAVSSHYLKCEPFFGNGEVEPLTALIPLIHKRLALRLTCEYRMVKRDTWQEVPRFRQTVI